jgi:protein-L-isoaspartate(D-aspartate) O-methyltransferase
MTDFTTARARMIDSQLRTEDVSEPGILAAMGEVPRERFVPEKGAALAYIDRSVPIEDATTSGPARYLMRPAAFGKLIQLAEIGDGDKVLDVGAGTGYSAAVLARIAATVVALENDAALVRTASALLEEFGAGKARAVQGPLEAGYAALAPYDVIVLEGSVEFVPQPLFDQLAEGGRLVAVIGSGGSALGTLFTRTEDDIGRRPAFNSNARPLPGFERPKSFVF